MQSCRTTAALLLFSATLAVAAPPNELVPMPKIRPEDPARFFPSALRLDETEVAEVAALFRRVTRDDLALQVEKSQALRAVPPDASVLTALLGVSSDRVKEWTLRGLGEHGGDKSVATPRLLALACDAKVDEPCRALAARVLGTTSMESAMIAKLADQIGTGSKEFSALLLEIIGNAGEPAKTVVPALRKHLNAPEILVQYYAYEALQKLDAAQVQDPPNDLAAVSSADSPGYLRAVALQKLVDRGDDPKAVRAVIDSIGHPDLFISELAANVLRRMKGINSGAVGVLGAGLGHDDAGVRVQSAVALRRLGTNALSAVPALTNLLRRAARGDAGVRETGIGLDILRAQGTNGAVASSAVAALLPEQCPIYRNVEKHDVDRFRGFVFITLAEVGVPKEALPFITDGLANSDQRMSYAFAGAARAAGVLDADAAPLVAHLARPLEKDTPQDYLDFDEFEAHAAARGEYTTAQIEILRALRRIGPPARSALPVVRAFHGRAVDWVTSTDGPKRIPRVSEEARQTMVALEAMRTAQLQGEHE